MMSLLGRQPCSGTEKTTGSVSIQSDNSPWHMLKEFEDTKGVIRICNLKDRQHNDRKKKDK